MLSEVVEATREERETLNEGEATLDWVGGHVDGEVPLQDIQDSLFSERRSESVHGFQFQVNERVRREGVDEGLRVLVGSGLDLKGQLLAEECLQETQRKTPTSFVEKKEEELHSRPQ